MVTASSPQPKEFSWIRSRSSLVFTKFAAAYSREWYIHWSLTRSGRSTWCQMGNRILCEHCHTIAVDQIRDTVMDLRVNMVRTAGKNDAPSAVSPSYTEVFPRPFSAYRPYVLQPVPPMQLVQRLLISFSMPEYPENSSVRRLCNDLFRLVRARNGFIKVMDRIVKLVHIVFDIFCIRGNDRAVVVVDCIREFISLVRNTRVENEFHTIVESARSHVRGQAWPDSTRTRLEWIQCPAHKSFWWR